VASNATKLNTSKIHHKETATISSLMTFCCITCHFLQKNQEHSSIEKNFLYLLISKIYLAHLENLRTNHLWFAIVSLISHCFVGSGSILIVYFFFCIYIHYTTAVFYFFLNKRWYVWYILNTQGEISGYTTFVWLSYSICLFVS
jgi:hypothetical protein